MIARTGFIDEINDMLAVAGRATGFFPSFEKQETPVPKKVGLFIGVYRVEKYRSVPANSRAHGDRSISVCCFL